MRLHQVEAVVGFPVSSPKLKVVKLRGQAQPDFSAWPTEMLTCRGKGREYCPEMYQTANQESLVPRLRQGKRSCEVNYWPLDRVPHVSKLQSREVLSSWESGNSLLSCMERRKYATERALVGPGFCSLLYGHRLNERK